MKDNSDFFAHKIAQGYLTIQDLKNDRDKARMICCYNIIADSFDDVSDQELDERILKKLEEYSLFMDYFCKRYLGQDVEGEKYKEIKELFKGLR